MRSVDRSSRILLAGALVSVVMHVAAAAGFVRWSKAAVMRVLSTPAAEEQKRDQPVPRRAERPKPPEIKLGIEKSEAQTMTWLGFEKATEHAAEQGTVEQSQMTLSDPGERGPEPDPGAPAEAKAESAPAPAPRPEAAPEAPAPEAKGAEVKAAPEAKPSPEEEPAAQKVLPSVDAAPEERLKPEAQAVDPALVAAQVKELSDRLARARDGLAEKLKELGRAVPAAAAKPVAEAPAAPPPAPPPAPKPAPTAPTAESKPSKGGGLPGIKTNKESVAVALKKASVVRPGQVIAAQGLDIQTREPRWTYVTLMTRTPNNPTVRITFGRDGKVRQAEFLSDGVTTCNTGYSDVDQPLIDAIYGWTAKGKALSELDPNDPKAGITILITILLRN